LSPPPDFADELDGSIAQPPPNFADDVEAIRCASVRPPAASSVSNVDDFAHLQPVIDKLPDTLTAEQREEATALIKRNADVFGRHEFDVGCTNLLTASIVTDPTQLPIAEPLCRHARVHLDTIDETIERMKQAGIVKNACSPWYGIVGFNVPLDTL